MASYDEDKFDLYLDDIDITTDKISFEGIDEDLAAFQEDEMVKQALQRGVDLKRYGRELEKELKQAESELVSNYVNNSAQITDLHHQMQECDAVLAKMQDMLIGFQSDLGDISEEIRHLQDESLAMNIKLKNRREAEEKLHKYIENIAFPPDLANAILAPGVSEQFLDSVVELSAKLKYLNQMEPPTDGSSMDLPPGDTFSGRLLLPELEKFKLKAISKAKDYFVSQFSALRKPKTNIQVIQQQSLVKYAPLLHFIQEEMPDVADDLRTLYVDSMGKTLQNLFKCYYQQLLKLDLVMTTKNDLLVVEEATIKSVFSQKVNMSKRIDTISLGDRDRVLDMIESEPILLHLATAENQRYPFEMILRSVLKHLCDAATNEFLFIIDFFKTEPRETFNRIFGKTLSQIMENIENYLLNCHDIVGILLMIRITHSQRLVMQRRRVPSLDAFFDRLRLLFWPRFKIVFDANLKSVKTCNAKKLGGVDLTPHLLSRRYAELVSSILTLCSGGNISNSSSNSHYQGFKEDTSGSTAHDDSGNLMVQNDLQLLGSEMVNLFDRLSQQLVSKKDQIVFLINNCDQIITIFQERRLSGNEMQRFEDILMRQRELFAEEEVRGCFSKLISFVFQVEKDMVAGERSESPIWEKMGIDEGKYNSEVESLVKDFTSTWKVGIQKINDDVMAYFANFKSGTEILKQVLTQLLLYYTRFQDIIKKSWAKPPAFTRDIISTASILMEIKKYSRTF